MQISKFFINVSRHCVKIHLAKCVYVCTCAHIFFFVALEDLKNGMCFAPNDAARFARHVAKEKRGWSRLPIRYLVITRRNYESCMTSRPADNHVAPWKVGKIGFPSVILFCISARDYAIGKFRLVIFSRKKHSVIFYENLVRSTRNDERNVRAYLYYPLFTERNTKEIPRT